MNDLEWEHCVTLCPLVLVVDPMYFDNKFYMAKKSKSSVHDGHLTYMTPLRHRGQYLKFILFQYILVKNTNRLRIYIYVVKFNFNRSYLNKVIIAKQVTIWKSYMYGYTTSKIVHY